MMLVDEGLVDLEAPVARYLPEFAETRVQVVAVGAPVVLKRPDHPITVHHALAHTSGLPFVLPAEHGKLDVLPLAESVAQSARLTLDFEPGTSWYYSNCGINVAGRIIEVVTGKPFEQVMRERLFAPLGMVDTTSFPSFAQVARLAKAYRPNAANDGLAETPIAFLSYPLDAPTRFACPGGGFFSTGADLARYARMLLNGGELDGRRYLSAAALERMTSSQTGNLLLGYGYGFSFVINGREFGHGGAYGTEFAWDPEHGLATIFLVQHDGFAGADGEEILDAFKAAAKAAFATR
jgi:CubicO group peptidase (beta-lactamase class C family)